MQGNLGTTQLLQVGEIILVVPMSYFSKVASIDLFCESRPQKNNG